MKTITMGNLAYPEPLTEEKKKLINQIVKNAYQWANERLPFKLRYSPVYRKQNKK